MSFHRPRVILIEDHPLVRASQRMLLEAEGYRVAEIAASADLAGFDAAGAGAQVIIADFDLGEDLTGIEVALEIMRRASAHIPTLVLSGSLGHRSVPAAAAAAMPLMMKPASEQRLLGWVEAALGGQRRDGGG